MKVAIILLALFSHASFAKLSTECVITRVGSSFNQTKYEVTVSTDAERYTQAKGQLVVHLIEEQDDRTLSETDLLKFSRRLRAGRTRTLIGGVTGIRAETCDVYFSGFQRDR